LYNTISFEGNKPLIIGVIPQYPEHTKQNIYGNVRMPPVGIISVLTQIAKDSKFDVYAIDENNYKGPVIEKMPDHLALQKIRPAKIAMFYGGMSNSIVRMFTVAKQYQLMGIPTIAGGSHVDALPREALNSGIDIVVHGEGEETARELVKTILKNNESTVNYKTDLENIVGISFLNEQNEYIFTGNRTPISDLDTLESPDLNIIKFMEKDLSSTPINRGRGCNYSCEFCVVNKQYGKYKAVSVKKTFDYLKQQIESEHKNFFFTDDNFAQNIPETIELCKMIGDYRHKFKKRINIMAQVRSEVAENDELLDAMKYAGVASLAIGYESPINEELKSMRKGVTAEQLMARSKKLSKSFYLHGMFIFGYPEFQGSKYKSLLSLKQKAKVYTTFFRKAKIDSVQVFKAVPLPGSELRRKLKSENRIPSQTDIGWDKYDGLFLCYVPEKGINQSDLQNTPINLMKKKYLGGFFDRTFNYANWADWAFNFTIGFPFNFSKSYVKNFFNNFKEKNTHIKKVFPKKNIFYGSLINAWQDIKKRTRRLAIKTYAGNIFKRWQKLYKKSDYINVLKNMSLEARVNLKNAANSLKNKRKNSSD